MLSVVVDAARRPPARVLCVDDDAKMLRAMSRALQGAGELLVETVDTPTEARARVLTGSYAVLVSDYEMPGENGVELIESIGARSDVVPVLVTAHAELRVALDAINRGHVYAYLRKPWEPEELVATVRRAVERFELGRALHNKIAELERLNLELTRRNEELVYARTTVTELRDLAATDAKTELRTYRFFSERLEEEVARARRYALPLSLLLLDLDGFKAANDRLGHLAGDGILRAVADILRAQVRVMDVVARFGGDELAVLLPNTSSVGAVVLCERLRETIARSPLGEAEPGVVTASIGVASLDDTEASSASELVAHADRALYRAKEAGKNRCEVAGQRRPVVPRGPS